MKYCGKCGEPTDNIETKICNNCSTPTSPMETQQPGVTEPQPMSGQIPVAQSPPISPQVSFTEHPPGFQQTPAENQPFDLGYAYGSYPTETYSTETGDISSAFYTTETGEVLPVVQQDHPEESKPKKKSLLPIFIGVGIIAAIAIAIGVISSGALASPVERFRAIQRDHIIDPILASIEEEMEEEVSFDLFITASAEASGLNPVGLIAVTVIEQLELEMNVDMSVDPLESIIGMNFNFAGANLLSAILTVDEDYLGFSIPSIDDTYYIISFDAFNDFAGGGQDGSPFGFEITPEEMASFIERYSEVILSIVNENNLEVNSETVSLFDGREEVNAQVYTVTPTEEDFRQFLLAFMEEIREDEFIYQIFAMQLSPMSLHFSEYETTREYFESTIYIDEETMDEVVESFVNSGFQWRVATYRNQLILQEITFEVDDTDADGNINVFLRYEGLHSGNQRTDWFSFGGRDDNDDSILLILRNEMTINRSEVSGTLDFSILVNEWRGEEGFSVNVFYDLDISTASILDIPYGLYEVEFNFKDRFTDISFEFSLLVEAGADGGTDHIITLHNLDDLGLSRLDINIHSTDEPSDIQAPTGRVRDLSEMSEMELIFLFMELGSELESLFDFIDQF